MNDKDLGAVIKAARNKRGWTQGQLSEKIGVGERHIMGIENEGKSPSFEVLFSLVHELNIPGDDIFYPENYAEETELSYLIRLLKRSDRRDIRAITVLAQALLDNRLE